MEERTLTPIGEMWLRDDGVLWHRIDTDQPITPVDAQDVISVIRRLSGGVLRPAVVDIRSVAYADRLARSAFAGGGENIELCTAFIVSSRASKAMAHLFAQREQPSRPIRMFEDVGEALEWAKTFLTNEGAAARDSGTT